MSRGSERRQEVRDRMSVLKSVQGHDNSVVHSFDHTEGRCPMCGFNQQAMMFCAPDEAEMPRVKGCELDGRHLHRLCGACRYPWIERCLDHAILAEQQGEVVAESELAAALAVILERAGGVTLDYELVVARKGWSIHFERDQSEGRRLVMTVAPPEVSGQPRHPDFPEPDEVMGQ